MIPASLTTQIRHHKNYSKGFHSQKYHSHPFRQNLLSYKGIKACFQRHQPKVLKSSPRKGIKAQISPHNKSSLTNESTTPIPFTLPNVGAINSHRRHPFPVGTIKRRPRLSIEHLRSHYKLMTCLDKWPMLKEREEVHGHGFMMSFASVCFQSRRFCAHD
ncbi:hypothetical protein CEXT_542541 [Caerostris extrusa]|uniref:Uncharacterized protein n=1 Tax=Caerostris extrusa TaxID=172846 RepID=A0AAV4W8I8_CAEEX|nr:hypothetical protein CEXT_542541 [Caerostris extrusa]